MRMPVHRLMHLVRTVGLASPPFLWRGIASLFSTRIARFVLMSPSLPIIA